VTAVRSSHRADGMASRREHMTSLDGVRAVAAYGVVATHAGFASGSSLHAGPVAAVLSRLTFGVTLFFLLSGFLLFQPFVEAALGQAEAPSALRFWWRRLVRIMPAYWLAVLITLAWLSTARATAADWLSYLTLSQTYTGHLVNPSTTQMWTLAVELSFYAVLPLLGLMTRQACRMLGTRGALCLLGLLVVASAAWDVAVRARYGPASRAMLWLPSYLDWFALGMLLAVAVRTPVQWAWRRRLGEWAQYPGTCWIAGALLYWLATSPAAGPRDLTPATGWEWFIQHYLFGAAAFFFLLPLVLGDRQRWPDALLGNRVSRWLGEISYAVYLWHLGLLLTIQRWLGWPTFGGHFLALFGMAIVASTAVAAVSWHVVERPLLRHLTGRWRGRVTTATRSAAIASS
jgi:peptidoglycan/LPS O-acetylase OafA/YrhL